MTAEGRRNEETGPGGRPPSPAVTAHGWGRVEVGGRRYRDAKLFPGGSREWDWRETGTHHEPGVQPADVEELLEAGARVVVLSTGHHQRLRVPAATLRFLEERGVEVEVLPTPEAVERYAELRGEVPVGALVHSTC